MPSRISQYAAAKALAFLTGPITVLRWAASSSVIGAFVVSAALCLVAVAVVARKHPKRSIAQWVRGYWAIVTFVGLWLSLWILSARWDTVMTLVCGCFPLQHAPQVPRHVQSRGQGCSRCWGSWGDGAAATRIVASPVWQELFVGCNL